MMGSSAWQVWCEAWYRFNSSIGVLLHILPYMSINQRNIILTATRVQPRLIQGSRFIDRANENALTIPIEVYRSSFNHISELKSITLMEILEMVQDFIIDPICAGFISTNVRAAPYNDYKQVDEMISTTLYKELGASLCHQKADLNFTSIFSSNPTDRFIPLKSNMPINGEISGLIHTLLTGTKRKLHNAVLYPSTSKKTIGRAAALQASQSLSDYEIRHGRFAETIEEVERVYHETGLKLEGETEVRSAWKYNNLKPRVYYARGPTVYHASKYIQQIFNIICDSLPMVHRKARYEVPPYPLELFHRLFIYDYTSFTSNLTQIRSWTSDLAQFYEGVNVWIVDTFEGPQYIPLSDVLLEFNHVCNYYPEFDIGNILNLEDNFILQHSAGMLGVPGNITPCTIIHGIHLAVMMETVLMIKCVGDDALGIDRILPNKEWREGTVQDCLENIGVINKERVEKWDYDADVDLDAWHYVKRPISRLESVIVYGELAIFPCIANLLNLDDRRHVNPNRNDQDRLQLLLRQTDRLLLRIHLTNPNCSELARGLVVEFIRRCRKVLKLPTNAADPSFPVYHHYSTKKFAGYLPPIYDEDDIGKDWRMDSRKRWLENGIDIEILVPRFVGIPDILGGYAGEVGTIHMTKKYGLMKKLGYIRTSLIQDRIVLNPSLDYDNYLFYLNMEYRAAYTVEVLLDFPSWFHSLDNLHDMYD